MWFTYSYKSILQYFFDTHFGLDRKINGNLQSFLRARCGFKKGWGGDAGRSPPRKLGEDPARNKKLGRN